MAMWRSTPTKQTHAPYRISYLSTGERKVALLKGNMYFSIAFLPGNDMAAPVGGRFVFLVDVFLQGSSFVSSFAATAAALTRLAISHCLVRDLSYFADPNNLASFWPVPTRRGDDSTVRRCRSGPSRPSARRCRIKTRQNPLRADSPAVGSCPSAARS